MNLFEDNEALGRLNDLIRIGEVSSINPEKCTARVVFDDDDSIVSYDLPILPRNTLNTHDFHARPFLKTAPWCDMIWPRTS